MKSLPEKCEKLQPIIQRIHEELPGHFVTDRGVLVADGAGNYADNFGLQWSEFSKTQHDSQTGSSFSEERLFATTGWTPTDLKNSLVLEIGSGAGRFTEILLKHGAIVLSVDLSSAVFVNEASNHSDRLTVLKSDFTKLSPLTGAFDFVLALGVAQHTPNPRLLYELAVTLAKPGGRVSVDHYRKRLLPSGFYQPKYLWRPLTTRMKPEKLLKFVRWYVPKYWPVDMAIVRLFGPRLSRLIKGLIPVPCWNYWNVKGFPQDQESLIEWAILDTFDALGAKYDSPISKKELIGLAERLALGSYGVSRGGNGLILNGVTHRAD